MSSGVAKRGGMERGRDLLHTALRIPFTFSSRRLRTRKSGNDPLTDFLLISPVFLSALVSPFFSRDRLFFLLPASLFFTDISCLKAENWSKLARACEINSPFVSWKTHPSSSPYFSSVRFFFAFCSFLSTAERSRVEIRAGR